jgi:hypothetical protein
MLRRPRGSLPTRQCDQCNKEVSKHNFKTHRNKCTGVRTPKSKKAVNAQYYNTNRERILADRQRQRARVEFNEMMEVKKMIQTLRDRDIERAIYPRPRFQPSPIDIDSDCPLLHVWPYPRLYDGTIAALVRICDANPTLPIMERQWIKRSMVVCHGDCFELRIAKPNHREEWTIWKKAITKMASMLIEQFKGTPVSSETKDFVKQEIGNYREHLEYMEVWNVEYEREKQKIEIECQPLLDKLERWFEYKHCDTFDQFLAIWMDFYETSKSTQSKSTQVIVFTKAGIEDD